VDLEVGLVNIPASSPTNCAPDIYKQLLKVCGDAVAAKQAAARFRRRERMEMKGISTKSLTEPNIARSGINNYDMQRIWLRFRIISIPL
jgi:hypothetical protein